MSVVGSSESPRQLDAARLRHACKAAETALRQGALDRRAIEDCFAALVTGLEDTVLASVYVREHDRLWLIAQRGYREVLDGFSLEHGVMARAVRTGQTQFVADVTRDPDFLEATPGIVAEVTVPFNSESEGRPQGALNIETIGATLPPEAKTIFESLARQLGGRLGEMREGLDVDVATLARLCVHASSLRGTSAIAEFASRTMGRLLTLDCVQLDLRPDRGVFKQTSFWRQEASGLEPVGSASVQRLALIEEQTGAGATYHLFDLRQTNLGRADLSTTPWIVWFPLTVAGGSIGAIIGRASVRPELEHERVEAAILFAQHAAALLDVSLALRREQRAAVTDALTGLLNRRGFDERLHEELERAALTDSGVALVLADCDDLKMINDRGGHELGDRVLQSFARCIRANKRTEDAAARIGGDEFAIILPGASAEAATNIAERLSRELRDLPLASEAPVVATFGVATFPVDGKSAADLLRAADRALYLAKPAGKDRTTTLPSADAA
ncbi:MAG TPA: diguanylate cyclase [Gaiellaceae bacterium]|nr:diguanylate cyclase [Gaiellaceae bacterium]